MLQCYSSPDDVVAMSHQDATSSWHHPGDAVAMSQWAEHWWWPMSQWGRQHGWTRRGVSCLSGRHAMDRPREGT